MSHEINAPKGLRLLSSDEIENLNSKYELAYICSSLINDCYWSHEVNFFNGDAVDLDKEGRLSLWMKNIPDEDGVYPGYFFMGCEYLDPDGNPIRSPNWIAGTQVQAESIIKVYLVSLSN